MFIISYKTEIEIIENPLVVSCAHAKKNAVKITSKIM